MSLYDTFNIRSKCSKYSIEICNGQTKAIGSHIEVFEEGTAMILFTGNDEYDMYVGQELHISGDYK